MSSQNSENPHALWRSANISLPETKCGWRMHYVVARPRRRCVRLDLQGGTDALSRMRPSNFKKWNTSHRPNKFSHPTQRYVFMAANFAADYRSVHADYPGYGGLTDASFIRFFRHGLLKCPPDSRNKPTSSTLFRGNCNLKRRHLDHPRLQTLVHRDRVECAGVQWLPRIQHKGCGFSPYKPYRWLPR